jgi:hypothetical protein
LVRKAHLGFRNLIKGVPDLLGFEKTDRSLIFLGEVRVEYPVLCGLIRKEQIIGGLAVGGNGEILFVKAAEAQPRQNWFQKLAAGRVLISLVEANVATVPEVKQGIVNRPQRPIVFWPALNLI